ncbi:MAG: EAL domain-containing protein [Pseudomonadales bacterium]
MPSAVVARLLVVIGCLLAGAALDFFTSSTLLAYLLYLGAAALLAVFTLRTASTGPAEPATRPDHGDEQLERSEARFRGAFNNAPMGMLLVDPSGTIAQVNPLCCEILGYAEDELVGREIELLAMPNERSEVRAMMSKLLEHPGDELRSEWCMLRHDGSEIWTTRHAALQSSEAGEPLHFIIQIADITEMKRDQQQMERLAFYDSLTDLANRRLFNDRLQQTLNRTRRSGRNMALLYLDLDRFKRVNDTLGHEAGDELLKVVAGRLKECVRQEDTVARPGGDEFTILLNEVRDARAAGRVAENILNTVREPVMISAHKLIVSTSIGITLAPEDSSDPATLTKNADLAMYRAKERGRNNYQFFADEMNLRAMERLRIEEELRRGLEREEFVLHFLPKVHLATREAVGVEALLRWQHPDRGLLQPKDFIGIAEESGIIVELGKWILEQTCTQAKALQSVKSSVTMAVNISNRQFLDPNLPNLVSTALAASELDPPLLELEITESMLMRDIEEAARIVESLRHVGVRIAIDDFGTGYSSLSYLKRLPIHVVKVDRMFISDIPDGPDEMAITAAVIAMAHKLNLEVVAEGIESPEQVFFLNEHQCEFGQGFFFSPPRPLDEIRELLEAQTRSGAHWASSSSSRRSSKSSAGGSPS